MHSCLFCANPASLSIRIRCESDDGIAERRLHLCDSCLYEAGYVWAADLLPMLSDTVMTALDREQAHTARVTAQLKQDLTTQGPFLVAQTLLAGNSVAPDD